MILNKRLIGWVFSRAGGARGHAQSEVYKCRVLTLVSRTLRSRRGNLYTSL